MTVLFFAGRTVESWRKGRCGLRLRNRRRCAVIDLLLEAHQMREEQRMRENTGCLRSRGSVLVCRMNQTYPQTPPRRLDCDSGGKAVMLYTASQIIAK
jgi:hypothetical protein